MALEPIIRSLQQMNPWWSTGRVPDWISPTYRRREFSDLMDALQGRRIPVLAGLRRSGKTTLVHQAIGELIARGVPPMDILYASLDDFSFTGMGPEAIELILDSHTAAVGARSGEARYMFLDEVQNVSSWAKGVKVVWDRNDGTRPVVTGSSGLLIRGAVGESLAGRATTIELGPWELHDWSALCGVNVGCLPWKGLISGDAPAALLGGAGAVESMRTALAPILPRYLLRGGLPEAAGEMPDVPYLRRLYEDVAERIIFRDIPTLYGIRQPEKLAQLMLLIADRSGLPLAVDGTATTLHSRHETVEDYIQFLLGSRTVLELYPFGGSEFARGRKLRKYYLGDTGLCNAILHRDASLLADATAMGAIAEEATAIHLARLAARHWGRLSYGPAIKGHEADFVLEQGGRTVVVESKFRASPRDEELGKVAAYGRRIGADATVVVTRDDIGTVKGCTLVPLWLLLMTE